MENKYRLPWKVEYYKNEDLIVGIVNCDGNGCVCSGLNGEVAEFIVNTVNATGEAYGIN